MTLKTKRSGVESVLQTVVAPGVAKRYEKYIFTACEANAVDEDVCIEESYSSIAFELVGRFMRCESKTERKAILEEIKSGTVDTWSTMLLDTEKKKEYDDVARTSKGVSVKKCTYKCKKKGCPSEECFVYQVQTRSADEGMTTYVVCVKCCSRYKFG